jgi:hypothetical protein
MIRDIVPGKTLYENPEEAFNDIVKFVADLDKRLEDLTIAFNEKSISDAANIAALSEFLKFSEDDVLDFYNLVKSKTIEIKKNIFSNKKKQ